MSKKSHFGGPIEQKHGKRAQTLLASSPHPLYHIYWSLQKQLSWKKYSLLICKSLGLFAKRLAANDKYSVLNSHKLMLPNQMQLCQKQKTFSQVFSAFLYSSLNFEHFEKKDCPRRSRVFEITDSENMAR